MIRLLLFCFIFSVVSSCSKESETIEFINLNQDFTISLNQHLSDQGSFPSILLRTTNYLNCANSQIYSENKISHNGINMTILDIITDGDCISGINHASTEKEIILPNGEYPFSVGISEITEYQGSLIIEKDYYDLVLDNQEGINVNRNSLLRIPNDIMWGTLHSPDLPISELFELMKAGLEDLAIEKNDLVVGDYDYFEINNDRSIKVHNSTQGEQYYHFVMQHNRDYLALSEYFKNLRLNHPNLLIEVRESSGIQF